MKKNYIKWTKERTAGVFKAKYLVTLKVAFVPLYSVYSSSTYICTESKEKHDLGHHTERIIEDYGIIQYIIHWYYVHKYLHLSLI